MHEINRNTKTTTTIAEKNIIDKRSPATLPTPTYLPSLDISPVPPISPVSSSLPLLSSPKCSGIITSKTTPKVSETLCYVTTKTTPIATSPSSSLLQKGVFRCSLINRQFPSTEAQRKSIFMYGIS
jgi:hypothetical protein